MKLALFASIFIFISCQAHSQEKVKSTDLLGKIDLPDKVEKIKKSDAEWKKELGQSAYYVLREAGTERPFTGDYWNNKKNGIYTCRACGLPLFGSDTKFKSGTGWPSFYQPLRKKYIKEDTDYKIGYRRTEVLCARCDGHLGHVFPDGPKPTGLRYCINSVSLDFVELSDEVEVK